MHCFAAMEYLPVAYCHFSYSLKLHFGPKVPKMGPNYIFAQKVPIIIWQKGVLGVSECLVMMLLLG